MLVSEFFTTTLWEFTFANQTLLQAWSNHVLTLEQKDRTGLTLTNQGGRHSRTDLLEDAALREMFQWIATCTQQAVGNFGSDTEKALPCFNNAWAMVNREGHSVRAHLHPNSLYSGVVSDSP